jgi:hypothetical protein
MAFNVSSNVPRTISPRWSRIRASSIWITWPIGFSSLIGRSFILEEAVSPESAKDSVRYSFPDIHWRKIRTNNPLERIMNEIRRRTRVVGAFPDGQSCLNLAAARLRYIAGTAWSAKCYMNMRPLYQPQVMQTEAVA